MKGTVIDEWIYERNEATARALNRLCGRGFHALNAIRLKPYESLSKGDRKALNELSAELYMLAQDSAACLSQPEPINAVGGLGASQQTDCVDDIPF